jgi:hypothetical protein
MSDDVPQEIRDQIADAARRRAIVVPRKDQEAFNAIRLNEPDFTVTGAEIEGVSLRQEWFGFGVAWRTKSAGYGHFEFEVRDGKLRIANEAMGKRFIKSVITQLDEAGLDEIKPVLAKLVSAAELGSIRTTLVKLVDGAELVEE